MISAIPLTATAAPCYDNWFWSTAVQIVKVHGRRLLLEIAVVKAEYEVPRPAWLWL
jgi:hypothetical protein